MSMRLASIAALLVAVLAAPSSADGQSPASAGQPPRSPARKQPAAPRTPVAAPSSPPAPVPAEPWRTWGGPRGNFTASAAGLASSWPQEGPRRLWTRTLGDGYSAIAEEHGILYTAYRRGTNDVVIALDGATGRTIWEARYEAPFRNSGGPNIGPGPYAMPQVVGDRIVMASGTGLLLSLDKRTGRVVWRHDLYEEFGGTRLGFGYSCHALPYKDKLIVLVGGRAGLLTRLTGGSGSAVVAFNQRDGTVAWQGLSFENAHSSPMLITVDGQPQVVALLAQEVIGFSPDDGAELWRHPHETPYGLAISMPVWGTDNILFVSSAYGSGSRALELRQSGGTTTVRELWSNPRLQLHFGSAIRIGGHVYMSDAYNGPALMSAVDVKTGKIAWQRRLFAKAQLLSADGKLLILDEDGTLALATATPQELQVLSQVSLLQKTAWTPMTLSGTRLLVRDRTSIVALDLGMPPPATKR